MTNFDPVNWLPYSDPNRIQSERLGEMTGRLTAVERAAMFAALAVTAPWAQPSSFLSGFQLPPAEDNSALRFYRDPVGRIYIEGAIHMMPPQTGPAQEKVLFTLPVGYRPDRTQTQLVWDYFDYTTNGPGGGVGGSLNARIDTNGDVVAIWFSGYDIGGDIFQLQPRRPGWEFRAPV